MVKRKIACTFVSMILLMAVFTPASMAAIPEMTIILGDKAFDISYLMDPANHAEINAAVADSNGILYYNVPGQTNGFHYIMQPDTPVSTSDLAALPRITYKDASGNEVVYEAGNGNPVTALTAQVEIQEGALGFKGIKVTETDVDNAVNFRVELSETVTQIGSQLTVLAVGDTTTLYILDAGNNVIASGTLDLTGAGLITVQLQPEGGDGEDFQVIDIY